MEFQVLGTLLVTTDGKRVHLGPPLQRKVLAALLVRRNEVVPRRRLIADVWSDDAPAFAEWELEERKRNVLHTYIARLRAALEPAARAAGQDGVIVTEGTGYRLVVHDGSLDESQFKDLAGQGHAALEAGQPAVAVQRLDIALGLWRGRPLGEFHRESFARETVARLDALRLSALEARVDAQLRLERHHDLIGDAGLRQWVQEHPTSERLWHALATALHRCGQTVVAVAVCRDGLAHLRRSGIESPVLRALLAELERPQAVAVPGAGPAAHPVATTPRRARHERAESTESDLSDALETLNRMVRRQWQAESALRQLQDPSPITVHWRPSDLEITDHQGVVSGNVVARTDHIGSLVTALQGLRWRRLVLLGAPGSGKTTLAVLLTLELAARRQVGDPVPILLSLSSWRPNEEHLHAWIRRRIAEDYPTLTDRNRFGGTAIRDAVADRRVLPVLDGLDELPTAQRPIALRAINRAVVAGDPLVVTSRLAEYRAAVAAGDVLTGAAVIQASPVRAADAISYLRLSTPPGARSQRWADVFDELAQAPDGPLATALSSPFAVVMTRLVYADSREPAVLTDHARFPDRAAIEDHLLDALIPTLVERDAQQDQPAARRLHTWDAAAVRRWLVFLAGHAHRLDTYDIAWWRLHESVPALMHRASRAAVAGALAGFVAAVLFTLGTVASRGLVPGLLTGVKHGLAYGLGTLAAGLCADPRGAVGVTGRIRRRRVVTNILQTAVAGGAAAGLVHFLAKIIEYRAAGTAVVVGLAYALGLMMMFGLAPAVAAMPGPTRTDLRIRGRGRRLARLLGWGLLLGASAGLTIGVLEQATLVIARHSHVLIEDRLVFGLLPGLLFGLVPGIACGLIIWARTPIALEEASSPRSTLRADRAQYVALLGLLAATATATFTLAAAFSVDGGFAAGVRFGFFAGLGGSAVIALVLALTTAWPKYTLARMWLAARRKVPWRLTTFLEEAQRVGILRQVGATYQFRHANLQDRLIAEQRNGTGSAD